MKLKKISLMLIGIITISCFFTACSNETNKQKETTNSNIEQNEKEINENKLNSALTTDEIPIDKLVESVKLCDYSNIKIETQKKEVTDETIQKEMEEYISYFDAYEHITEGVVENGQKVDITYVGKIDGEEFDGGSGTIDLEIGSNTFIEGFESGLIGKKVGEDVTLNLKFPEPYESNSALSGKDVTFEVKINYILGNKIDAELTDEFLSANADYKSVEELKTAVTKYLTESYENEYNVARENEVLDYLISNSEIPKIPVTFIDEYKASMKSYYETYATQYNMEFSEFIQNTMGISEEDFDKESETAAINYMQSTIVLKAIAKSDGIELSDEEFNEYVDNFANKNNYSSTEDLLKTLEDNNETDEMKNEALYNKVMNNLFENVIVETE